MKNAKLAYKVLDHITEHPEEWDQRVWVCGTAKCFAGHVVTRSGYMFAPYNSTYVYPAHEEPDPVNNYRYIEEMASKSLGISRREGSDLFASDNSLQDLRELTERIFGSRPES